MRRGENQGRIIRLDPISFRLRRTSIGPRAIRLIKNGTNRKSFMAFDFVVSGLDSFSRPPPRHNCSFRARLIVGLFFCTSSRRSRDHCRLFYLRNASHCASTVHKFSLVSRQFVTRFPSGRMPATPARGSQYALAQLMPLLRR
jgi:hypothetical protein